jgi:hypothetical protein
MKMQLYKDGTMQGKGLVAVPFAPAPASLPADIPGYVGFDPLGLSTLCNLDWLREAEIKHGRVAMLAATGAIVQDVFQFPVFHILIPGMALFRSWHCSYVGNQTVQ